jgi:hypothetical protein
MMVTEESDEGNAVESIPEIELKWRVGGEIKE